MSAYIPDIGELIRRGILLGDVGDMLLEDGIDDLDALPQRCGDFDGASYLSRTNAQLGFVPSNQFGLSVWVLRDNWTGSRHCTLFGQGDGNYNGSFTWSGGTANSFALMCNDRVASGDCAAEWILSNDGTAVEAKGIAGTPTTAAWSHLYFGFDFVDNLQFLIKDGAVESIVSGTNPDTFYQSAQAFNIGAIAGADLFNGRMYQFATFKDYLPPVTRLRNPSTGNPRVIDERVPGLFSLLTFENGAVAYDAGPQSEQTWTAAAGTVTSVADNPIT